MLTTLILVVGSVTVLVALLLVIVVIGIRQEPPMEELREHAPSLTAVLVRRLLGVYVRKPPLKPNAPKPKMLGGGEEVIAGVHGGASSRDAARRPRQGLLPA